MGMQNPRQMEKQWSDRDPASGAGCLLRPAQEIGIRNIKKSFEGDDQIRKQDREQRERCVGQAKSGSPAPAPELSHLRVRGSRPGNCRRWPDNPRMCRDRNHDRRRADSR
jgi:hypothetical protein